MPKKRLTMRKLREVFRLKFELGRKHREIAVACKVSPATVSEMVKRLGLAGLSWPCGLTDQELEDALYCSSLQALVEPEARPVPDWAYVRSQLRRPEVHVTLNQLWKEYKAQNPDNYYGYSWFCGAYQDWSGKLEPVMRQTHKYGDKCFVDFAGDKLSVVDPETGVVREAEVFVATMGASNYVYCDVCWSQDLANWLRLHIDLFDFLGGCPAALVPDNLKAGVTKACYYEPSVNLSYEEMAKHYGVAVLPARVRKPKDKAKVENGVLIVEREVLAPLRDRVLVGLSEAKEAVWEKLEEVNNRPFQKLDGTRRGIFLEFEKPVLKPLPTHRYDEGIWLRAKVHIDYHIAVKGHHYSVPYVHIGKRLEVRVTSTTVEAFWDGSRVAGHRRSWAKGGCTTDSEHMPEKHRRLKDWTPERVRSWAETIGPHTQGLVIELMARRQHPEQGVRACLGVLRLRKKYGIVRLEAACKRAVTVGAYSYRSVLSILDKSLDKQPLPGESTKKSIGHHENVRGADYYEAKEGTHHVVATNY